jgi:formylglycine-generating enzyme required for sulfatase activity
MGSEERNGTASPSEGTIGRFATWKAAQTHHSQKLTIVIAVVATLITIIAVLGLTGRLRRLLYWPMRMEWVKIPAGTFSMGSSKTDVMANEDELPQHDVFLKLYKISKYEVTNQQYLRCVNADVCETPNNKKFDNKDFRLFPVNDIRWDDAQTFCEWTGGRLPTEAEWEKSARGLDGKTMPWIEGIYCWQMNYGSKCFEGVADVGSKPEDTSYYGAKDMAGNAWEWVSDWYAPEYYSVSPYENPQGPSSGNGRVLRGTSWRSVGGVARVADRDYLPPDQRGYNIGFRCASL